MLKLLFTGNVLYSLFSEYAILKIYIIFLSVVLSVIHLSLNNLHFSTHVK